MAAATTRRTTSRRRSLSPAYWLDDAVQLLLLRNGRAALAVALRDIGLKRADSVLILTTTGGPYISSCVTRTIERFCSWSREPRADTRAALVIHEFGFPCAITREVRALGVPIIEDCAYGIGTRTGGGVGGIGDYALYSLPKYFPLPFGGILAARSRIGTRALTAEDQLSPGGRAELRAWLGRLEGVAAGWNAQRRRNWRQFAARLAPHGLRPYFDLPAGVVPGAFVARLPRRFDGAAAKQRCNEAGIESTEYYGMGGFYFPVHQFLADYEKQYIQRHLLAPAPSGRP
jgi:hypothetical protein